MVRAGRPGPGARILAEPVAAVHRAATSHATDWMCRSCRFVLGHVHNGVLQPAIPVESVDGRGVARVPCPRCGRVRAWEPSSSGPPRPDGVEAVREAGPGWSRPLGPRGQHHRVVRPAGVGDAERARQLVCHHDGERRVCGVRPGRRRHPEPAQPSAILNYHAAARNRAFVGTLRQERAVDTELDGG
jgi:hypothetical protein